MSLEVYVYDQINIKLEIYIFVVFFLGVYTINQNFIFLSYNCFVRFFEG